MGEPVCDGIERNPAGGCELEVWHGRQHVLEVARAEVIGGKHFDQIGAGFKGGENFRGGQGARQHGLAMSMGGLHDLRLEHR